MICVLCIAWTWSAVTESAQICTPLRQYCHVSNVHPAGLLPVQEVLFMPDTYRCESKYQNLIAFDADVSLLTRVLRGAGANDADTLEMRLAQKALETAEGETINKPVMTFIGKVRSACARMYLITAPQCDAAARDVSPECAHSPWHAIVSPTQLCHSRTPPYCSLLYIYCCLTRAAA